MTQPPVTNLDGRTHALYRFYNQADQLLYVGITADVGRRWGQHSDEKPWWGEVTRCTIEHFPSRPAVLSAEAAAIKAEAPRYNLRKGAPSGTGGPVTRASGRDRLGGVDDADLDRFSLVGSYFHGDLGHQWQGCVVAEPAPGVYLVELFDWTMGASSAQHLVRLADMDGWSFYDTAEWMNNAYHHGGVARRWERDRKRDSVMTGEDL